MSLFILLSEVSRAELQALTARAFESFTRRAASGSGTEREEIGFQPLQPSPDSASAQITVAELWHGQTLAFKDLPLQFLGQLLSHFLARRQQRINVLVGTSGDTGSAAIEAVRNSPYVNIFVLYPSGGRITAVQELQMTTVRSDLNNVHVVACDGTSDELDVPILRLFDTQPTFKDQYKLCSINSVNVIRILMQCVHFIYAYLRVKPAVDAPVDFVLPTGAAGHIAAGVLTKQMGLPIGQLCAATNDNDLMTQFLNTGSFHPRALGAIHTSSPAIDIQVPYNVERILYSMAPGQHLAKAAFARRCMQSLSLPAADAARGFDLSAEDLARWKSFGLVGVAASHRDVVATIAQVWKTQQYLLDPHTSVAVHAARSLASGASAAAASPNPSVVFATAHASKFIPTVVEATGLEEIALRKIFSESPYDNVRRAMGLHELPAFSTPFARGTDWEAQLRELVERVNKEQRCSRAKRTVPWVPICVSVAVGVAVVASMLVARFRKNAPQPPRK